MGDAADTYSGPRRGPDERREASDPRAACEIGTSFPGASADGLNSRATPGMQTGQNVKSADGMNSRATPGMQTGQNVKRYA